MGDTTRSRLGPKPSDWKLCWLNISAIGDTRCLSGDACAGAWRRGLHPSLLEREIQPSSWSCKRRGPRGQLIHGGHRHFKLANQAAATCGRMCLESSNQSAVIAQLVTGRRMHEGCTPGIVSRSQVKD